MKNRTKKILIEILVVASLAITWILWQFALCLLLICFLFGSIKLFGITDTLLVVAYTLSFCFVSMIVFVIMNDLFKRIWRIY